MPENQKKYELIINGQKKEWHEQKISYTQVVDLAFPPPHTPTEVFTVMFSHGPKENREGDLVEGQSVFVAERMVFNVKRTDKS